MSDRSSLMNKLQRSLDTRAAYIKAKLGVLVPSQIRALRLKFDMPRQSDLAKAARMHQSRISMFETPGAANITLETIAKLAAALKVGVVVEFVPYSRMLRWENEYSQDRFDVVRIDEDFEFLGTADFDSSESEIPIPNNGTLLYKVEFDPELDREIEPIWAFKKEPKPAIHVRREDVDERRIERIQSA